MIQRGRKRGKERERGAGGGEQKKEIAFLLRTINTSTSIPTCTYVTIISNDNIDTTLLYINISFSTLTTLNFFI